MFVSVHSSFMSVVVRYSFVVVFVVLFVFFPFIQQNGGVAVFFGKIVDVMGDWTF